MEKNKSVILCGNNLIIENILLRLNQLKTVKTLISKPHSSEKLHIYI